jgi:hypothetical protein
MRVRKSPNAFREGAFSPFSVVTQGFERHRPPGPNLMIRGQLRNKQKSANLAKGALIVVT